MKIHVSLYYYIFCICAVGKFFNGNFAGGKNCQ